MNLTISEIMFVVTFMHRLVCFSLNWTYLLSFTWSTHASLPPWVMVKNSSLKSSWIHSLCYCYSVLFWEIISFKLLAMLNSVSDMIISDKIIPGKPFTLLKNLVYACCIFDVSFAFLIQVSLPCSSWGVASTL